MAEIVTASAGTWKKRLAIDAMISSTNPTNRNLRRKLKSRFETVAIVAMTKNTAAVIAPASATSWPPFFSPAAKYRIGVSESPEMKVKPNTAATPQPLLRSAATTKSDAIIAPNMASGAAIG